VVDGERPRLSEAKSGFGPNEMKESAAFISL
jgi:hypothetical protein